MVPISSVLAEKARDRIRLKSSRGLHSRVMRAEVKIPRVDALDWLRRQAWTPRVYWSDREKSYELAGCGAVDEVIGHESGDLESVFLRMAGRLEQADQAIRFYGGSRFASGGFQDPAWRKFGYVHFVMPRFELSSTGCGSTLACHWLDSAEDTALLFQELDLMFDGASASERGEWVAADRSDLPDLAHWREAVNATLTRLSVGELEKLVLARRSVFDCAAELDPLAFLAALAARADHCYRFCFMPSADVGFLGLSPERLYRREKRRVLTEGIAGTRPRGRDPSEDAALERELKDSGKEQREHAYVVRGVRERLAPLCGTLDMGDGVSVLKLQECQHLMSVFRGYLRDQTGDLELLRALHPTPAVGGYPADAAVRELARVEPFDRGWYAGPIGWIGKTEAEFAVAIRSGLVAGTRLTVYAGAGIVEGSMAENEWRELDNKIRHFTRILNWS